MMKKVHISMHRGLEFALARQRGTGPKIAKEKRDDTRVADCLQKKFRNVTVDLCLLKTILQWNRKRNHSPLDHDFKHQSVHPIGSRPPDPRERHRTMLA